jgi:hypothetical protein
MAKDKFDPDYDYDQDGDTGDKKDRKQYRENKQKYNTGKPTVDTVTSDELVDIAGIPDEWITENSELEGLLNQAIQEGWHKSATGQAKFTEAFLNSTTYSKHGASMAAYLVAKDKGGKDFENVLGESNKVVEALAATMGVTLTDDQKAWFGERSVMYGWDESDLRKVLTGNYEFTDGYGKKHSFNTDLIDYDKGWAQNQRTTLMNLAYQNGVSFNDGWYNSSINSVASGLATVEDFQAQIRKQASSSFPVWAKQIEAGFDVRDLASPYTSIMQKRLGRGEVGLDDPLLRQAFNSVGEDGRPAVMGTWDFEKMIKRTDEWAESEDGHNEVMGLVRELGRTMGFTG